MLLARVQQEDLACRRLCLHNVLLPWAGVRITVRDLEDLLAEKAQEDDAFRERVGEAVELHGLLKHPGWIALEQHFRRGNDNAMQNVTSRQLRGEEVSLREIDFLRGCIETAEAIFKHPTLALKSLETTAQLLMRKEFESEVERLGVASPYIEAGEDT